LASLDKEERGAGQVHVCQARTSHRASLGLPGLECGVVETRLTILPLNIFPVDQSKVSFIMVRTISFQKCGGHTGTTAGSPCPQKLNANWPGQSNQFASQRQLGLKRRRRGPYPRLFLSTSDPFPPLGFSPPF